MTERQAIDFWYCYMYVLQFIRKDYSKIHIILHCYILLKLSTLLITDKLTGFLSVTRTRDKSMEHAVLVQSMAPPTRIIPDNGPEFRETYIEM